MLRTAPPGVTHGIASPRQIEEQNQGVNDNVKSVQNGICPAPDADTLEEQMLVHNVHPVHFING